MTEKARIHAETQESKQKCSNSCKQNTSYSFSGSPADRILQIQRTAGNQAVQRLIKSRALQAKLKIGRPNDIYEQEADRVAEQVMRMPDPVLQQQQKPVEEKDEIVQTKSLVNQITPLVQRQIEEEEEEPIQRKEASIIPFIQRVPLDPVVSFESEANFEARLNSISSGSPLPSKTRAFMESRFGADFSEVRLHTGSEATQLNRSISAQAFTQGRNIYLGEGKNDIESNTGKKLLAHELTHVIQQQAAPCISWVPTVGEVAGAGITTPAKPNEVSRKGEPGFGNKPRALTPAEVKKFKSWEKGVDDALNVLTPFIRIRGNAFLDQWLTQMISAKSDAQAPADEEKDYWIVALLGNLLWAASVFVPGAGVIKGAAAGKGSFKAGAEAFRVAGRAGLETEAARATGIAVEEVAAGGMTNLGKTMYATLTVGGGIAASGVVQRWATDPSGDPTGKELVALVLNTKRKEMGKALEGLEERLAYDLVLNGFTFDRFQKDRTKYMTAVEEALWVNLFPTIAKDDLSAIYTSGLNAINGALADFKKQYRAWKDNIQQCTARFFVPMTQRPHTEDWPEEIRSGRERPLDYCRRRLPFKPKLDF